jgi:hypothetical protein
LTIILLWIIFWLKDETIEVPGNLLLPASSTEVIRDLESVKEQFVV